MAEEQEVIVTTVEQNKKIAVSAALDNSSTKSLDSSVALNNAQDCIIL